MLIYKCDGHRFKDGKKCENTYEVNDIKEHPFRWIVINGKIKNDSTDSHIIESNGMHHYCSRTCLEYAFFKNLNARDISKQFNLLKNAQETMRWMFDNMKVENPDLQSDGFNIPANTLTELEDYLQIHKEL